MKKLTRRNWFHTLAAAFVLPWLPKSKSAPAPALDALNATTLQYIRGLNAVEMSGGDFIADVFQYPDPRTTGTATEPTAQVLQFHNPHGERSQLSATD
jgi:hypothetical protein